MGITIRPTVPVERQGAQPAAEPWPVDEHTIRIDEMFARQLDTEFSGRVRALLHAPETGIAAQSGEAALEAIAGALPALNELKQRTLAQAMGPRQRTILESLIETRLDRAAGTLGQMAQRATMEVDDASVADRLAGLNHDAAFSWRDPAYLKKLGRTAVEELRYQGERRGWEPAETDARVRGSLSDLYAEAVEAAIGQDDLDGASALYDHARVILAPERQAAIDRRFMRAHEVALYRDIDRDLAGLPIEPAGPPDLEVFAARAAERLPEDASDDMRAHIGQVAVFGQRRAERQWHQQQSQAGIAALNWVGKNPDRSFLAIPPEVRDWLAPDQWRGLEAFSIDGRLATDRDLFERLDRQMIYEPGAFASADLDRYLLSLDDEDRTRFAGAQKAIVEGTSDPAFVRYRWTRLGIDRALDARGIDIDGPEAAMARADARDWLKGFEAIEGRAANGEDIDGIVKRAIGSVADTAIVREASDPFDPQYITPANNGRPPSRPPAPPLRPGPPPRPAPGPGHNNPPRPKSIYEQAIERTQRSLQSPPPAPPQPQPDTAGPAAATTKEEARPQQEGGTTSSEPVQVKDLTRLSNGEIRMLKKGGFDIHKEKKDSRSGPVDLFKDREGNIYVGRQGGHGEAEPLSDNIQNYR